MERFYFSGVVGGLLSGEDVEVGAGAVGEDSLVAFPLINVVPQTR